MKIIVIFLKAILTFTFTGGIGWVGLILIALKIFGFIHWSWWIAGIPLEYGVIYCLYMTLDGEKYRAGLKEAGLYARNTQGINENDSELMQIHTIINQGPEYIGETIDRLSKVPNRLKFNQALLDKAVEFYEPLKLAMFGNKSVNAHLTIIKWRESGLIIIEDN